ncbi:ribosomal protein L4 [Chloropicon primus]|uniref:Large ribosomal subunit protein uL4m n=2 Tax=Chloropicon primus TaxID=1764295 RepID=A0A5B8MTD1_9CHLO|nr:ribosomal protein L4 [Chloropicon primus]UPR02864.1 ribosomal protein L4 [Chloropicon primus]|eukprot:QDZ23651.1 ribosomal protein L4 [Chloropicon primus]
MLIDRVVPVVNRSLEGVGSITLPGLVYDQPLRKDIVHRVVVWQRANWRQGTVKVKTRSEVRGGGRKPWPQKGTGRARAGSIRSPLFRGGGKAHGPRPKDWSQSLNSKIRRLGLRVAVSSKLAAGQLTVVDELKIESKAPKTKELTEFIDRFEHDRTSFLLVDDAVGINWEDYEPVDPLTGVKKSHWQWRANLLRNARKGEEIPLCEDFLKLKRSAKNLKKRVKVIPPEGLNVYDLLAFDRLVMTPRAVKAITYRLSHPPPRFH